jgi:hypothetical protein
MAASMAALAASCSALGGFPQAMNTRASARTIINDTKHLKYFMPFLLFKLDVIELDNNVALHIPFHSIVNGFRAELSNRKSPSWKNSYSSVD